MSQFSSEKYLKENYTILPLLLTVNICCCCCCFFKENGKKIYRTFSIEKCMLKRVWGEIYSPFGMCRVVMRERSKHNKNCTTIKKNNKVNMHSCTCLLCCCYALLTFNCYPAGADAVHTEYLYIIIFKRRRKKRKIRRKKMKRTIKLKEKCQ